MEWEKQRDKEKQEIISNSIHQYFSEGSDFIFELEDIVKSPTNNELYSTVTYFDEPVDADKKESKPGTATAIGSNDLGQEKTYYVRFDTFINHFLNKRMLNIIRKGLRSKDEPRKFISDILDSNTTYSTIVGYNKHLKSTDPSVLIIRNTSADADNASLKSATLKQLTGTIKVDNGLLINNKSNSTDIKAINLGKLNPDVISFNTDANRESGTMLPTRGVWVNSKTIQQVFLGARTIAEGLETLLNKINAATEGYWDLKLMHDTEDKEAQFRIVDDNHTLIPTEQ